MCSLASVRVSSLKFKDGFGTQNGLAKVLKKCAKLLLRLYANVRMKTCTVPWAFKKLTCSAVAKWQTGTQCAYGLFSVVGRCNICATPDPSIPSEEVIRSVSYVLYHADLGCADQHDLVIW